LVRVLHVINGEHYAGAERVQDLLALRLGEFGFAVGFACLKPGQFPDVRQSQPAPLYPLPMSHRFDLRPARQLARIVRRDGYRLIHSHTVRSALLSAIASLATGVPMVHHIHSPTARDTAQPWRNRLNAVVEQVCLRRASVLIAVSGSLAGYARRIARRGQEIAVVHNGVLQRPSVPARNGSKTTWTLGTVAFFRPRKGIEILLQALAVLAREGLPVRLRAVGGFETAGYEASVKGLAKELDVADRIVWTGFTTDVDAELAQMDLFVLPSLFGEGLPMVLLEAMAAGVPVIGTRVEGIPEAIRAERDGLLVEPGDPSGLAAAVRRVIRGEVDWQALRQSALERHAREFSDRSMAAAVAEVYRRVLRS